MLERKCDFCYPAQPTHELDKFFSYLENFVVSPFFKLLQWIFPEKFLNWLDRLVTHNLLRGLEALRIIKPTTTLDRSQYANRALVIWDEAQARHLQISSFRCGRKYINIFLLKTANGSFYFHGNPIYEHNNVLSASDTDDKEFFKKKLAKYSLPHPVGRAFWSQHRALEYGQKLGFPLVVKPIDSSLSRHAFFNLNDTEALLQAIKTAKKISAKVVVEKFIPGDVYRAIILGSRVVAIAKRVAAAIVGDGQSTVRQLIEKRNEHPWRAAPEVSDSTLHKINLDAKLEKFLAERNLSYDSILPAGEKVDLHFKVNLGNSADIINVTPELNPATEQMFAAMCEKFNIPFLGLDFICEDIRRDWREQPFAIIENNTLPYIDMHHFPSSGEPINVAGAIWDYFLSKLAEMK